MKSILTFIFIFSSCLVFGQDTTYYDVDGNKVKAVELAESYKILERNEFDTNRVTERNYFTSGQIKSEKPYSNYNKKVYQGNRKEWFENGQIKKDINYKEGMLHGQVLIYWENGQLSRKDNFKRGKLIEGKVWNSKGEEIEYYDYLVLPEFRGGVNGIVEFISQNTKYPRKSKRKGIEGKVFLSFVVDKKGNVKDIEILQGVNEEINAESIRVVQKLQFQKPGQEDGEAVNFKFNLPLNFYLRDKN